VRLVINRSYFGMSRKTDELMGIIAQRWSDPSSACSAASGASNMTAAKAARIGLVVLSLGTAEIRPKQG
jgi:hypothetical protein